METPKSKLYHECTEKMKKAVEAMEHEFSTLRTGRANPTLLDVVEVDAYGQKMSIKQVATVSTPDAHTILVQPWDRGQLQAIEKAILAANIGMTPNNDGKVIRLNIPALTEERRKELVKVAHKMAEDGRVAIRNVRRHVNEETKQLEKDKVLSEDDSHEAHAEVQKITDKFIEEIGVRLKRKEQEIMAI